MKKDPEGCVVVLTEEEYFVNRGLLWTQTKVLSGVSSPVYFLQRAGSKPAKVVTKINCGVAVTLSIFGNPTVSADGEEVISSPNGLNSDPIEFKTYSNPIVDDEGIKGLEVFEGGSGPSARAGAGVNGRAPFVIPANQTFLLKVEFVGQPTTVSILSEVAEIK